MFEFQKWDSYTSYMNGARKLNRMNPKATIAPIIAATVVVIATVLLLPFQSDHNASASDTMMSEDQTARGQIASIQLGSTGQPEWIQAGIWVIRMHPSSDTPWLIARFDMIKPDGTATHSHKIYDFSLSEMTREGNSTAVLRGTATVSMRDGPVSEVPITVKVFNNAVIGFWIGPDSVDGHFGTGPVYGTLSTNSQAVMKDIHLLMQGMVNSTDADQTNTIELSALEIDEVYRWSTDAGTNPTLTLIANTENVIQIQNPTDEKHELVIESDDIELASSGDIAPDSSGQLTFKPAMTGTFEYHCEYHPDTMKGTIEVNNPS
jgi:cupredoxin-like protein